MADELENISNYNGAEKYYYIREIYRRHGYHPLKSLRVALGFLIQVPFFIAVYHFLGHYENFSGVGFLFIKDLSRPDALFKGINILPFVMTGINLISAFVFTRGIDKSEKLQLVPRIVGAVPGVAVQFPSRLGVLLDHEQCIFVGEELVSQSENGRECT